MLVGMLCVLIPFIVIAAGVFLYVELKGLHS
jgi:hypothetical protein